MRQKEIGSEAVSVHNGAYYFFMPVPVNAGGDSYQGRRKITTTPREGGIYFSGTTNHCRYGRSAIGQIVLDGDLGLDSVAQSVGSGRVAIRS
jgi:hypothetical protein